MFLSGLGDTKHNLCHDILVSSELDATERELQVFSQW